MLQKLLLQKTKVPLEEMNFTEAELLIVHILNFEVCAANTILSGLHFLLNALKQMSSNFKYCMALSNDLNVNINNIIGGPDITLFVIDHNGYNTIGFLVAYLSVN